MKISGVLAFSLFMFGAFTEGEKARYRVILTGNRENVFSPCGCTSNQIGGLAHEAKYLKDLIRRDSQMTIKLADIGNTVKTNKTAPVFGGFFKSLKYSYINLTLDNELEYKKVKGTFDELSLNSHRDGQLACLFEEQLYIGKIAHESHLSDFVEEIKRIVTKSRDAKVIVCCNEELQTRVEREIPIENCIFVNTRSALTATNGITEPDRGELLVLDFDERTRISSSKRIQIKSTDVADEEIGIVVNRHYDQMKTGNYSDSVVDPYSRQINSVMTCKPCHEVEYSQWQSSGHAHAYETLAKKDRLVYDCLRCHSTAVDRSEELYDSKSALIQESITCITCHGLSTKHTLTANKKDTVRTPAKSVCIKCHQSPNDEHFDFTVSFSKIRHKVYNQ
jgi:hypothetical protein